MATSPRSATVKVSADASAGDRLHIHGIKEMPAGYDAEVAELFQDLRAASGLSEADLAAQLATRPEVVQALEQGALFALPPWPETYRVVATYGTLLNLDVQPLLRRIYAQVEAGIVELAPKSMPDVPFMAPPDGLDRQPQGQPASRAAGRAAAAAAAASGATATARAAGGATWTPGAGASPQSGASARKCGPPCRRGRRGLTPKRPTPKRRQRQMPPQRMPGQSRPFPPPQPQGAPPAPQRPRPPAPPQGRQRRSHRQARSSRHAPRRSPNRNPRGRPCRGSRC